VEQGGGLVSYAYDYSGLLVLLFLFLLCTISAVHMVIMGNVWLSKGTHTHIHIHRCTYTHTYTHWCTHTYTYIHTYYTQGGVEQGCGSLVSYAYDYSGLLVLFCFFLLCTISAVHMVIMGNAWLSKGTHTHIHT
jgi:hypothetical protein